MKRPSRYSRGAASSPARATTGPSRSAGTAAVSDPPNMPPSRPGRQAAGQRRRPGEVLHLVASKPSASSRVACWAGREAPGGGGFGQAGLGHGRSQRLQDGGDVAGPAQLGNEPPAGAQGGTDPADHLGRPRHPVQGGVGEDGVDRLVQGEGVPVGGIAVVARRRRAAATMAGSLSRASTRPRRRRWPWPARRCRSPGRGLVSRGWPSSSRIVAAETKPNCRW